MAETRMLPRKVTRSTGIDRTSNVTARPNNAAGNNATSHVSAGVGVSPATHAHVVHARDPAGASRQTPPRAVGGSIVSGVGRGTAAKVEIMPSVMEGGHRRGAAPRPATQVIAAPRGDRGDAPDPRLTSAPPMLSPPQMLMCASLLERYLEHIDPIQRAADARIAQGALDTLTKIYNWMSRQAHLYPQRAGEVALPVPAPVPAPVAPLDPLDPVIAVRLDASTSTTIIGPATTGSPAPEAA